MSIVTFIEIALDAIIDNLPGYYESVVLSEAKNLRFRSRDPSLRSGSHCEYLNHFLKEA